MPSYSTLSPPRERRASDSFAATFSALQALRLRSVFKRSVSASTLLSSARAPAASATDAEGKVEGQSRRAPRIGATVD